MRQWVSAFVAAGVMLSQADAASLSSQCEKPADKTAFDVAGLKSQLMVTALSCAQQDKYNAFIDRFRPNLVAQDRALNSYFGRAYGRHGQQQHDDYVTSLANQQSEEGTKLGSAYCQHKVAMFDEVMALPATTDLTSYASGQAIAQPIALVSCPASSGTHHGSASSHHKRLRS